MIDLKQPKYRGHGKDVIEFLSESNAIEGVYDEDSLDQAIYAWKYLSGETKLTPGVILKTHKILMLHQRLLPNERGYFRRCDVQVGGQIKLSWSAVPYAVQQWIDRIDFIKDVRFSKKDLETMNRSLHIQYEDIHPFVDGNGRTGRMLMNWWRLTRKLSILVIKENEKQKYYAWFK